MKLALECTTKLLPSIQPLADFDWVLAHKVLEDPDYAEYYKASGRFKVLDNSVNEFLTPVDLNYLDEAASYVKPDLIVAPDYLGDMNKTREAVREAIHLFGKEKIFPVVQGKDIDEILNLFKYYLELGLERVAIPYDILAQREDNSVMMASNRRMVVNSIITRAPIGFEVHLLGLNTLEELSYYRSPYLISIDTGVPVLLGLKGYKLGDDPLPDKKEAPTMNLMDTYSDEFADLSVAYYNVAYLRKLLNHA
jgi:hypothetical protein